MYESHFGLHNRPFRESIALEAVVPLKSRDAALHRLRYGLEYGEGIALLHGPPGTGKSLLARQLGHELGLPTIHLTYPALPTNELISFLADEMHAPGGDLTLAGSVRRLRSALASTASNGRRTLLIVDECHLIADPITFETLRLLTNFATNGPPDVMLLLVGGSQVLLNLPAAFRDRLASVALLGPLTEEEAEVYLEGRLRVAGAEEPLFDTETVRALYQAADGLPRRLNRLADLSLLIAYAQGKVRPDLTSAELAARDLNPEMIAA